MDERDPIDRRTVLERTAAVAGGASVVGCLEPGSDGSDDDSDTADDGGGTGTADAGDGRGDDAAGDDVAVPDLIEVENPPDAVYVPTHREGMRHVEEVEAGEVVVTPMVSYPHPFWIVSGTGPGAVERVDPPSGRGVHLMVVVRDRDTGRVLPVDDGVRLRVYRDGEQVGSALSPWTMLSQRMGLHFGDNVSLPEDGTYTVEVAVPPLSTRTTGALAGRLNRAATATFAFEYDDAFREAVVGGVEYLDEDLWGLRGALDPMANGSDGGHGYQRADDEDAENAGADGGAPYATVPEIEEYPAQILVGAGGVPDDHESLPRSADASVLAAAFDPDHRLSGDGRYLLVSPRTPYNRVPLADASVAATVERDGETVAETALEQTIDDAYGLHYGATVADLRGGDAATVAFRTPPQVARHRGYETAFLEMPPVELTVPEESGG